MTACVVDASVVVKWFFPEEHSLQCLELLSTVDELLASDLVWAEASNVVWKRLVRGEIIDPCAWNEPSPSLAPYYGA